MDAIGATSVREGPTPTAKSSTTDLVFVDTNVLIYVWDGAKPDKQGRARTWMTHLWQHRRGRLSIQVLQEFYVTATMKLSPTLGAAEARKEVRDLFAWQPLPVKEPVIEEAWALQGRYSLSWWDALIVAAARLLSCTRLLTEDLQDGQDLGGVRVTNPFLHPPPG